MAMDDKLAKEQLKIYDDLLSKRKAERDDDWQLIAQYALPQEGNIQTDKTEGVSGWTDRIFDTTVIQAMDTLGAGLGNWWTPRNQDWAEYELPEELKDDAQSEDTADDEATNFLGRASAKVMKELRRSNFYMAKATSDTGLSVFATDLMIFDESESGTELFNFVHCQIGTYVIEENYKGLVDTVRREIGGREGLTFRQIEQMFDLPGDNIPEKMREQSKGSPGGKKKWKVLHCIFPREDSKRLPGRKDGANKPVASVYISVDFKEVMRVSGYEESPILCRRFKKWVTAYGYGPGYLTLPDARQVNYIQQYVDALGELHAYPRVLIPDDLEGEVDLRAGGTTITSSANPESRPQEWATVGEYKLSLDLLEQKRQAIRDACFVDAFKLLNSAPLLDKEMTAFEISQRQAEQLQNMTAVDARTEKEFIQPLMQRAFGIMLRRGKLKDIPNGLRRPSGPNSTAVVMPEIASTSRFSQALKALMNRGTDETFKFMLPLTEQKPELWDNFDLDKDVREYARNAGMSPDALRRLKGPNSVETMRAQRAKAMQEQRAAQMAETLGKAGKGLGGSPQFMQDQVQQQMEGAAQK